MNRFSSGRRYAWLALIAIVMGVLAIVAGDPYRHGRVIVDTSELARQIEQEDDHISAVELSEWIMAKRQDYRLIDLRQRKSFAKYHIPTAESMTLDSLTRHALKPYENVVLYSGGGVHAAQGWMLLKAQGYRNVHFLRDGMNEWFDTVLEPRIPSVIPPDQQEAFEHLKEVCDYFGGSLRIGANGDSIRAPMPVQGLPDSSRPVVLKKRRIRESC